MKTLLSTACENKSIPKTKVNKSSVSVKELLADGVAWHSRSKCIANSTSEVDRVCNHSLVNRGENIGVAGKGVYARISYPDRRVYVRGIDNKLPLSLLQKQEE